MGRKRRARALAAGGAACAALALLALWPPRAPEAAVDYECYTATDRGDYHGRVNTTRGGHACEAWPTTFAPYAGHNFCRRPALVNVNCAWCFTNVATRAWECCRLPPPSAECAARVDERDVPRELSPAPLAPLAPAPSGRTAPAPSSPPPSASMPRIVPLARRPPSEPPSELECFSASDGSDYRGHVSRTAWGSPCQRWDKQAPHIHQFIPSSYPGAGLEANYCRRPGGQGPHCAWCFVESGASSGNGYDCCDIGAAHATRRDVRAAGAPCPALTRPTLAAAPPALGTRSLRPAAAPMRAPCEFGPVAAARAAAVAVAGRVVARAGDTPVRDPVGEG